MDQANFQTGKIATRAAAFEADDLAEVGREDDPRMTTPAVVFNENSLDTGK